MHNSKDFFKPLAFGAPEPLRNIPFPPSRVIHFFAPSNPKMLAKVPEMVAQVDILCANLEDAVPPNEKAAARAGLIEIGKSVDMGSTQLWTRINALDSPWILDDLFGFEHLDFVDDPLELARDAAELVLNDR